MPQAQKIKNWIIVLEKLANSGIFFQGLIQKYINTWHYFKHDCSSFESRIGLESPS